MAKFPHPHVISATCQHTHTIILLHGRGSNGPEFAGEFLEARTSKDWSLQKHFPGWKWVFPSSQTRYSTLFQEEMDEWFDIYSLTDPTLREELQVEGLQQSVDFIHRRIQDEAKHVPLANIVLGGISQGCATAVHAMLSLKGQNVGAFVGFCSWMPFPSNIQLWDPRSVDIDGLAAWCPPSLPVFLSHSKDDELVDFELGVQLRNALQLQPGLTVTWREYDDGGHWVKEPEGFDNIIDFLVATFESAYVR